MHGEYLLLLAGCLLITLPLELSGTRVYRRPRALVAALLPVVLIFGAWDVLGIERAHWWYEPSRISGIDLFGRMPIEEFLFMLVVPICGLLTLGTVRRLLGFLHGRIRPRREPGAG